QPINPTEIISFTEHKLICDTLCLSQKTFDYISEAKKAAYKTYASSKGARNSKGLKGVKSVKLAKGTKVHVVQKGDTLSSIARRYGTTAKVLCQKNGLKATATLRLGQKLKL
ncbi:MAG: LysM peptidoglycan-binding domain-containing protein, partial [Bacteroidia bacterium]